MSKETNSFMQDITLDDIFNFAESENSPTISPEQAWFVDDLRKSGISESTAKKLGIELVDAKAITAMRGFTSHDASGQPCKGYVIPFKYPDSKIDMTCPDGRIFRRIKPKEPSVGHDGKLAKYLSPKGAGQHAYILPEVHEALQKDGAMVILTEGEKKAICATEQGLPVIGLIGIWGWRDPANGKGVPNDKLLPELISYTNVKEWLMIFDSDASDAAKVYEFQKVAIRLSKVLSVYNVSLKQIILPSVSSAGKTGLDDFAIHYGAAFNNELKKLMDTATVVSPDLRALTSKMNGQNGGRPLIVKEIVDVCADSFRNSDQVMVLRRHRNDWFQYTGTNYRKLFGSDVKAKIMELLRKLYPDHATIHMQKTVIANLEATDLCGVDSSVNRPAWLDGRAAGRLLITKNCVINIDLLLQALAGTAVDHPQIFTLHSPQLFSDKCFDYPYDALAQCLQWNQYVTSALPDPDDQKMLQMMFGVALLPDTSYNVFFLLYGPAGTGKSVAIEVLRAMAGQENCCAVPLDQLGERFALQPLSEKLLNVIGDQAAGIPPTAMDRIEGQLKDITGGSCMRVERKGVDAETKKIVARCVFASNHFPPFRDTSNGLWDRLRLIPFDYRFRGKPEQIQNLAQQIIDKELPGVLVWALKGLAELYGKKIFPESANGQQKKQQQRCRMDSIGAFLQERTEWDLTARVTTTHLYGEYVNYCQANGLIPSAMTTLATRVATEYSSAKKTRQHQPNGGQSYCWIGIKLKP